MKFIHLGDLHLGKFLYNRSLLEDQRHMLEYVFEVAVEKEVSAIIIAGDIYDKTLPPIEAVKLFGYDGHVVCLR